jgi:hypothetical protein
MVGFVLAQQDLVCALDELALRTFPAQEIGFVDANSVDHGLLALTRDALPFSCHRLRGDRQVGGQFVKPGAADAVLATQLGYRQAALQVLGDGDDLAAGKPGGFMQTVLQS